MSRLIESWKKSGWEYYFYDDDTAGEFLSTHFPQEVREAYESITPGMWYWIELVLFLTLRLLCLTISFILIVSGAFKADLFRYCVLLIRGGVYADMDVLLETNLNDAIPNDIGFMTPIDEVSVLISGLTYLFIVKCLDLTHCHFCAP
jgi:mannosyltransferase OCH1-like enzyme